MLPLCDRFLRERQWIHNVSPKSVEWHQQSLSWLTTDAPTKDDLTALILRMRQAGLAASSVNCRSRSINAFLHWSGSPARMPKLKEESSVPSIYTRKQVAAIVHWKARTKAERRLHVLLLTLFDTGTRLDEALSLRVADVNMDDLLLTVTGKGRKQRVIPFSTELRRALARYITNCADDYVFATKDGRKLSPRNVLRDTKALCQRLGFTAPRRTMHATRHTFATEYLRRGGSLFHLQKMLGHTSLDMVRRYASLSTEDLSAVHERVSLLSR